MNAIMGVFWFIVFGLVLIFIVAWLKWWLLLAIPIMYFVTKPLVKAEQQKTKAKRMRQELRLQQEAELAAEWDRRHGKQQPT
ncbi:MAG: hypothetical protein JWR34_1791 [Mycobacterium sp.]|nr:hypothetical protein [Mycobacterium sp.]